MLPIRRSIVLDTRRGTAPYLVVLALVGIELASVRAQEPATPELAATAPEDEPWIEVVWPGQPTPAGDYLRVGGLVSLELINWDQGNEKHDGLDLDALSLLLSGRVGEFDFFVDGDLDGEDTRHNLREAWLEHTLGTDHWVRAGWLRVAQGSELATREEDLPHVGYGFTSWENGRFGPGVSVDGYALPWFWWQATATAGYDTNLAGDQIDEPQGSFRLLAVPPRGPDGAFEGLFGGFGMSKTTKVDGNVHVETPFDEMEFETVDMEGDSRSFLALEAGYRRGGFRAGGEWTDGKISSVELPAGNNQSYDEIGRYTFWFSWNFRGPAPVWSRGRWLPYDLKPGDEMPLELAVRYSNADIDRDFFDDGLATFGPSVNEARTITVTLSTYLQPSTRVGFSYLDTVSDQVSNNWGEKDHSYLLRLDQRF
jgi:hypothetical protein